ncbi:hypothetical protein DPM13_12835 [Paracoccus mutanolyticus]|uniref:Flp pilus-assembly TadG-like N-terminal domain-containing protein n=1 Tax=Paracoccus mutanolyticus TaxID=1499308 RepID=A0ABM6WSQ9_9RHOB|nr:hypothetical protein DPM13_12835 [Paracoccus mutanolyticus]
MAIVVLVPLLLVGLVPILNGSIDTMNITDDACLDAGSSGADFIRHQRASGLSHRLSPPALRNALSPMVTVPGAVRRHRSPAGAGREAICWDGLGTLACRRTGARLADVRHPVLHHHDVIRGPVRSADLSRAALRQRTLTSAPGRSSVPAPAVHRHGRGTSAAAAPLPCWAWRCCCWSWE